MIPYGMRVPVALRRLANCYTMFTFTLPLPASYCSFSDKGLQERLLGDRSKNDITLELVKPIALLLLLTITLTFDLRP